MLFKKGNLFDFKQPTISFFVSFKLIIIKQKVKNMFLTDFNERRGCFSDEQIPFSAAQLRKVQNMDLSGNNFSKMYFQITAICEL